MSTPRTDEAQRHCGAILTGCGDREPYLEWYGFMSQECHTLETELQACHAVMEEMASVLKRYQTRYHGAEHAKKNWEDGKTALASFAKIKSQKP